VAVLLGWVALFQGREVVFGVAVLLFGVAVLLLGVASLQGGDELLGVVFLLRGQDPLHVLGATVYGSGIAQMPVTSPEIS
jgi:hypothetical protein